MRVLVTGGAGFVGRHLVRRLLKDGFEVRVVDSGETGNLTDLSSEAELHVHDIASLSDTDWDSLLSDVSYVFHLAARKYNTPGMTAEKLVASNATATWRMAASAARSNVLKVVYSSSLYAYGQVGPSAMSETDVPTPTTVYGAAKLFGEHALRCKDFSRDLNWSVARFFFVYGPGQFAEGGYKSVIETNFERMLRGESPTVCGSGTQSLDYVFVEDVVDGLIRLAQDDRKLLVNLGSGQGISINELTEKMIRIAGFSGAPQNIAADWTEGTSRVGTVSDAKTMIGWEATTTIDEGLKRVWDSKILEAKRG